MGVDSATSITVPSTGSGNGGSGSGKFESFVPSARRTVTDASSTVTEVS